MIGPMRPHIGFKGRDEGRVMKTPEEWAAAYQRATEDEIRAAEAAEEHVARCGVRDVVLEECLLSASRARRETFFAMTRLAAE